ncbi:MAG: hypothetical protein EOL86_09485 [Deltaproteobacteria bacterium]|nr:hypothetical protein [Deltaproteobacteria bacterium]
MSTSPISDLYEINVALNWIADGMEYNERDYGAAYTLKAVTARLLAIIHAMEVDQHNEQVKA